MKRARLAITAMMDPSGLPMQREGLSGEQVQTSLFRILKANVLCSMATVTPDNQAHINTAYFCYSDALELYFLSHPHALHCRNLDTNASMAMTIFSSSQQWGGPDQGVQLFGRCAPVRGAQVTQAEHLYGQRFPAYATWKQRLGRKNVGRGYRLYRFLVERVKVFDEKHLGEALFVEARVHRTAIRQ